MAEHAVEMRATLGATLESIMERDQRVVIFCADLAGGHGISKVMARFPDRSFNVGVQEANMTGMAAGMAASGYLPFIFTFAPFATRRIADQVFVSIAYANNNVKIFGGDPGVTAELNGGTHMTFEDVAIMRSYPNMVVVEPADNVSMASLVRAVYEYPGPTYMRFNRKTAPDVHPAGSEIDLMGASILRRGTDLSIFASGIEVAHALQASEILLADGIDAEVIDVHTIKPLDTATVIDSVRRTGLALTCENHNVIGGLGSAVAEATAAQYPVRLGRIGIQDEFGEVGDLTSLVDRFGLGADAIRDLAVKLVSDERALTGRAARET